MLEYPALVDGEPGAYGVAFPDLPGICAMGYTVAEALAHAEEALLDYAIETEKDGDDLAIPSPMAAIAVGPGERLVSVPLIRGDAVPDLAGQTGD